MKMYTPIHGFKISEKEAIQQAAEDQGKSTAEFIREAISEAIESGLDLDEIDIEETAIIQFTVDDRLPKQIERAARKNEMSRQHFVRSAIWQGVKKHQENRSNGNPSDTTGAARGEEGCPG